MTERSVADIVADLRNRPGLLLQEAADLLEHVAADNNRLLGILANTDLEDEITRALGHIPARYLRDGEPWEEGVRRMHEEVDELRQFDPQQIIEQERHNRSLVEAELERLDALRPTCPTCDGSEIKTLVTVQSNEVVPDARIYMTTPCPENGGNCDGRMSWERMAAIVTAVFDGEATLTIPQNHYLRSVRP